MTAPREAGYASNGHTYARTGDCRGCGSTTGCRIAYSTTGEPKMLYGADAKFSFEAHGFSPHAPVSAPVPSSGGALPAIPEGHEHAEALTCIEDRIDHYRQTRGWPHAINALPQLRASFFALLYGPATVARLTAEGEAARRAPNLLGACRLSGLRGELDRALAEPRDVVGIGPRTIRLTLGASNARSLLDTIIAAEAHRAAAVAPLDAGGTRDA